jgi:flagellar basal-body rod protein FlgF
VDSGLYSGVAAMDLGQQRLDTIAANLANLTTPAFKRLSSSTQGFSVQRGARRVDGIRTQQAVDFSQGVLQRTANPLDVALVGDGFFAVDTPAGEIYTRNGAFRLDERGLLQTAEGYPVVWEGGRGRIEPVGAEVVIDASGTVLQGDARVGRLKLVAFAEPERLTLDRQGYFHAPPRLGRSVSAAEVHQGALESSNVGAIDELVAMIQVQRSFEIASNLMRSIDQTYRRLVTPRG